MMEIHECLVCDASIWPVAHGYLCFQHRKARHALAFNGAMARLQVRVQHASDNKATDWSVGQSHQERQCAAQHAPQPWQPKFDDIMRRAMYWLQEDDGSEAA
jgi:hypothetical protein